MSKGEARGRRATLVYEDQLARHVLSEDHPMRPVRLAHACELMRLSGMLDRPWVEVTAPRTALETELTLVHTPEYVEAVKSLDNGLENPRASAFGFGPGDNPVYEGIYRAQALAAGSAIAAMEVVDSGEAVAAFAPAGGLHHAMPSRASGFCVFNDPAIIIQELVRRGRRVAYVDIDCHHGDGVQHVFYETDRVLTISLHESGQFLFPGTGFTTEIGVNAGKGFSVNVPLAPYTDDSVYEFAFDAIVPPLIRAFAPDVLVTQLGIDTHLFDPITHLRLTTQGFARTVGQLAELADDTGKWIALGGGGYDPGAVARGWSMAFAVISKQDVPDQIPVSFSAIEGLTGFADMPPAPPDGAAAAQIRSFAERSVEEIEEAVFPHLGARR